MRDAILGWYDAQGRALPFRGTTDPYAVLVSEVMAQQTQIGRVGERWGSFLARFPTIAVLAAATPADVLREWRGLGYNRRAIALWRTAQVVMEKHGGELPRNVGALERLPGIGPYSARAVAAIAFGMPVGAVDTNVRRVLGRALSGPDGFPAAELQALADASVPAARPGEWTHALMDVGATFCRSRSPRCGECPARPWCRYAASDRPDVGPVRRRPADGSQPFSRSSRWLRGRIMDRLTAQPGEGWIRFAQAIGDHDPAAVARALAGLARDGLLEVDSTDTALARLGRS